MTGLELDFALPLELELQLRLEPELRPGLVLRPEHEPAPALRLQPVVRSVAHAAATRPDLLRSPGEVAVVVQLDSILPWAIVR